MGYAIIWSSGLAAALFFVATAAAFSARLKRRWVQVIATVVAALPASVFGASAVAFAAVLRSLGIRRNWLGYSLSWTVLLLAGTVLIIVFALRKRRDGGTVPRGVLWPREKLAAFFAAALAVCVCTLLYMDAVVRLELVKVRGDARALALSVAPARVPERENAALVYAQAFEHWRGGEARPDSSLLLRVDEPGFPVSDEAEELLRRFKGAVVLLRRAAAMPGCHFETDCFRHPAMVSPRCASWRRAADLLALDARNRAAKGDAHTAAVDIVSIWRMVGHAAGRPDLISCMISLAIDDVGSKTVEHVLAALEGAGDLGPLAAEARVSPREIYVRSLRGEESLGLALFPDVLGWEGWSLGSSTGMPATGLVWRTFLVPDDLASYRYWMRQMQMVATMPFCEARQEMGEMEKRFSERRGGLVSSQIFYGLVGAPYCVAACEATRGLVDLGLAATTYRAEHGSYPGKLADVVPDHIAMVPVDPFSGEPLRMLAVEDGLVLYSVGRDCKDQGGAEKGDITFCLGSAYTERRLKRAREKASRRGAPPE